ncbi:unnamed protein product [Rhizophagus irregularis]|nr:unnamed protein product [Rhizophagus irregularis]
MLSLANNQISKVIEERLRLMTLLEDSSIIIDLRTNNGFQEIYTGTSLISILIRYSDPSVLHLAICQV